MRVRVDAARHDVAAGGVELVVAVQVRADGDDLAVLHQHVGLPGAVGGDDGAVLDDFGHVFVPLIASRLLGELAVQAMRGSRMQPRMNCGHSGTVGFSGVSIRESDPTNPG